MGFSRRSRRGGFWNANSDDSENTKRRKSRRRKYIKRGVAALGLGLAAYGTHHALKRRGQVKTIHADSVNPDYYGHLLRDKSRKDKKKILNAMNTSWPEDDPVEIKKAEALKRQAQNLKEQDKSMTFVNNW